MTTDLITTYNPNHGSFLLPVEYGAQGDFWNYLLLIHRILFVMTELISAGALGGPVVPIISLME